MLPRLLVSPTAARRSPWLAPVLLALLLVATVGCSSENQETGGPGGGETCSPGQVKRAGGGCCEAGELPLDDGRCLGAGTQENGCPAGEVAVDGGPAEGGGCRPAGVPPDMCGLGFEPDGEGGCNAVLPVAPCPQGMMAIPGETECREVAPCGEGTWGDIPVEDNTQFVDGSYGGENGPSDGSAQRPWTTVKAAIGPAKSGAIIAVAEGSYGDAAYLINKPVRIWGRCPALTEIVGLPGALAAFDLRSNGDGAEIHNLAVRGSTTAVAMSGSTGVLLDRLWIHDANRGVNAQNDLGPTSFALSGSLIERVSDVAVFVEGSSAEIDSVHVRDSTPKPALGHAGLGVVIQNNVDAVGRSTAKIARSVIQNVHYFGMYVSGSDAKIETTFVGDTMPHYGGAWGLGVHVQNDLNKNERANVTLAQSVFERNHRISIHVIGADVIAESIVVRDTLSDPDTAEGGVGATVETDKSAGPPASLTIRSSLFERSHQFGLYAAGAILTVESSIVRATESQLSDSRMGVGIHIQDFVETGARASAFVRSCVVADNHHAGLVVGGSDLQMDGTVLRGTRGRALDQSGGVGIVITQNQETGARATAEVRSSIVHDNQMLGVFVEGADLAAKGVVVEETLPQGSDGSAGRGVQIQRSDTGEPSTAQTDGCVVRENRGGGIVVVGSKASIQGTDVQGTADGNGIAIEFDPDTGSMADVQVADSRVGGSGQTGIFVASSVARIERTSVLDTGSAPDSGQSEGDGIVVATYASDMLALVDLIGCSVSNSARFGLSSIAATVHVESTDFECNPVDLVQAPNTSVESELDDLGGNTCGCSATSEACQIKSLSVKPPELDERVDFGPG